MPVVLYRVDERLIHGQVVVGWGSRLSPDRFMVVDDALAEEAWERELYLLSLPEGVEAEFLGVHEARSRMAEWQESPARTIVLFRNVETLTRMAEGGELHGVSVNLGGVHHGEGRVRILPYLHLSEEDGARLRRLDELEVDVSAQDLPGSTRVPARRLLEILEGG